MQQQPNPTGCFEVQRPDEPGYTYTVSRTGIVLYPKDNHTKQALRPWVLSFVNGSMALNPVGEPIDAAEFDHYAVAWIDRNSYRLPRFDKRLGTRTGHTPTGQMEPGVAYWDPDLGYYTLNEPQWYKDELQQLADLSPNE